MPTSYTPPSCCPTAHRWAASLTLGLLLAAGATAAQTTAPPAPACTYAGTDPETAAFLALVDRAGRLALAQTLRDSLVRTTFDVADTCFSPAHWPAGDGFRLIERFQPVSIQALAKAEHYKRVEELGLLRVVVFADTAAAQACQRAVRAAQHAARRRPYNPETTGPLQEGGWSLLVAGRYVVWLADGARCCPDLHRTFDIFRDYLYEAIDAAYLPAGSQPRH